MVLPQLADIKLRRSSPPILFLFLLLLLPLKPPWIALCVGFSLLSPQPRFLTWEKQFPVRGWAANIPIHLSLSCLSVCLSVFSSDDLFPKTQCKKKRGKEEEEEERKRYCLKQERKKKRRDSSNVPFPFPNQMYYHSHDEFDDSPRSVAS